MRWRGYVVIGILGTIVAIPVGILLFMLFVFIPSSQLSPERNSTYHTKECWVIRYVADERIDSDGVVSPWRDFAVQCKGDAYVIGNDGTGYEGIFRIVNRKDFENKIYLGAALDCTWRSYEISNTYGFVFGWDDWDVQSDIVNLTCHLRH